jgi:hypothetical protein
MGKMHVWALAVSATVLMAGAAPLLLRAQGGGAGRGAGGPATAAAEDDLAHRTAKQFAPFVRALIQRRLTTAQQLFKVRRPVMAALEDPDTIRVLSRYQRPQRYDFNLVAGRLYGPGTGVVLFTIVNEDGPVYFKIHYYTFNEQTYIDQLEISDAWEYLEEATEHLDMLPSPVSVPLNAAEGLGGM